jgi:hypothetical protein
VSDSDAPIPKSIRRRRHSWGRVSVLALVGVAVLGGYAWFLWALPQARISVVLSASSESVAYRVIDSDMSVMHLFGLRATAIDGSVSACADMVVTPALGARVEYRRGDDDHYSVTIDPRDPAATTAFLREKDGKSRPVKGSIVFASAKACGDDKPQRLPIWGPAEFGEELRPPGVSGDVAPGILVSGTISVYGRAHERLLGLHFPPVTYLVSSFDLPAGSVLSAKEPDGTLSDTAWTGLATTNNDDPGFTIAASTDARNVSLTSARAARDANDATEQIDLGGFAQFLNDPNVVQIQVIGGVFFLLLQGLGSLASFMSSRGVRDKA